jgi:hypothetical protein
MTDETSHDDGCCSPRGARGRALASALLRDRPPLDKIHLLDKEQVSVPLSLSPWVAPIPCTL